MYEGDQQQEQARRIEDEIQLDDRSSDQKNSVKPDEHIEHIEWLVGEQEMHTGFVLLFTVTI